MRETEFIDQNKEKWKRLELLKASKRKDPEQLSELFIEATNDLSYSKSYYPNRSIRIYLNSLALQIHASVYKTRKGTWSRIVQLWLEDIPRAYYQARKMVLLSAVIFFASVAIGVFSAAQDPGFVGLILGEDYVAMTLENMRKGDPMGVYKSHGQMDMTSYITLNNIRVAFFVFVLGILGAIGTVGALISNGVMLGSFQYLFYDHGYLKESLLTVWMHGTPEIGAIILAGAAGMTLGKGLIFPGTYTRGEALLIGAKRGVLLLLGTVPIFFFAGFIEGFVTRYTELPDLIRALFILICGGFMLTYFVIMPFIRFSGRVGQEEAERLSPSAPHDFNFGSIRSHGQIFSDCFAVYGKFIGRAILPGILLAIACIVLIAKFDYGPLMATLESCGMRGSFDFFGALDVSMRKVDDFFSLTHRPLLYLVNWVCISAMLFLSLRILHQHAAGRGQDLGAFNPARVGLTTIVVVGLGLLVFFIPDPWSMCVALPLAPVLLTLLVLSIIPSELPVAERLRKTLRTGYRPLLVMCLTLFAVSMLCLIFFNSTLTDYLVSTLINSVQIDADTYGSVLVGVNGCITYLSILMLLPLFPFAAYLQYFTAQEVETASYLHAEIDRIGERDKAYGFLRE